MIDNQNTEVDLAQANFKLAISRAEEEDEFKDPKQWTVDKMTKYIVFVQRYIEPVCTEEAEMIFEAYFSFLRSKQSLPKDRKTVRMLESLIRLAEAHARLMFRKDIIIFDAISVIILMEHCLNTGLFDENYPVIMSR
jgi:DNA helicase MCM9